MAACWCAADGEAQEFLQCLFQGLHAAINGALQCNAQVQQAQGITQVQVNQLLQGQLDLKQPNQEIVAVMHQ